MDRICSLLCKHPLDVYTIGLFFKSLILNTRKNKAKIGTNEAFKSCIHICIHVIFMSNLLRRRAAVLLRHALPHRLFHWLDFLAQWNPRRSGGFDHFSVYCLLLFTLWSQDRKARAEKDGKTDERRQEWDVTDCTGYDKDQERSQKQKGNQRD